MTASAFTPRLAPEHVVYLYRLLRDALGTGKQTFLPRVEKALAADGLAAEELGFASTRALLEAMGDVVQLTVFKGGRVYATVVAQEAWDAALSKADAGSSDAKGGKGKGGKSWKRKRASKGVKAVRPRAVAKPSAPAEDEAADEALPLPDEGAAAGATDAVTPAEAAGVAETAVRDDAPASAVTDDAAPAAIGETEDAPTDEATPADEPAVAATGDASRGASANAPMPESAVGNDADTEAAPAAPAADDEHATVNENAQAPADQEPRPAISLTVIYDPEHANAGVTTLESTPGGTSDAAPAPGAPVTEREAVTVPEAAASADSTSSDVGAATSAPAPVATTPAAAAPAAPQAAPTPSPAAPEHVDAPAQATQPLQPMQPVQPTQSTQPEPTAAPSVASPAVPADVLSSYPHDFIAEVYCPGPILSELAHLLPLGADIMGIVDEYYHIACERGTIELARNRAAFPVRYRARNGRRAITVHIKKRPRTAPGARTATWTIASIDHDEELAASGTPDAPEAPSNDASPQG